MRNLVFFLALLVSFSLSAQETLDNVGFPIDTTGWTIYPDTTKARMLLDDAKVLFDQEEYFEVKEVSTFCLQSLELNDTLEFEFMLFLGEVYSKEYKLDSMKLRAHEVIQKSIKSLGNLNKYHARALKLLGISYAWEGQMSESIESFKKGTEILKQIGMSNSLTYCHLLNNIGLCLDWINEPKESVSYFQGAIEIIDQIDKQHPLKLSILLNLGNVNLHLSNYNQAIPIYRKTLVDYENLETTRQSEVAKLFGSLGSAYNSKGDMYSSIPYLKKCIALLENQKTTDLNSLGLAYNLLGNAMGYTEEYKLEGLKYIKKNVALQTKAFGENNPETAASIGSLASYYTDLNKYEKAEDHFINSLNILNKTVDKTHPFHLKTLNNLGLLYSAKREYDKAIAIHEELLTIKESISGENVVSEAETMNNLANVLLQNSEFSRAKTLYHKGLKQLKYIDLKKSDLSDIDQINTVQALILGLIDCFSLMYGIEENEANLDSLDFYNSELISIQDYFHKSFSQIATKKNYLAKSKKIYERALSINLLFNNKNKVFESFYLSEKNKSRLLLEEISNDFNVYFRSIPIKLKEKEHITNIDIAYYEKKKFQEEYETKEPNDSLITVFENRLFDLKRERDELIETLKTDYPDYWNLKYNFDLASVKEVQNELQEDQSLLEYFVGDSSVFVFVVRSDTFHIEEIKKDFALEEWVSDIQRSILSEETTSGNIDSLSRLFVERSRSIYQKIVAPVEDLLTEEVIIVPDGVLGYLPFDVLVTNDATDISDAKYFIHDHQIAYQYSATLWLEMKKKKVSPKKQVLAYAPDFPARPIDTTYSDLYAMRNDLWRLRFSKDEVNAIDNTWSVDKTFGEDATVQNFIRDASDYRIVHLSTHGKADDRVGDYCYLAFTKTSDTLDRKLYVRDLYNMKLNADMVVLSACETGLGELQQGEGILSLARGFAYAGAKSIVSTLWSVDDKSTSDIMASFYKHLKDGKTKDASLRQAKLDYLFENPNAHPFYWAAFTAVGDMSPIESGWPWSSFIKAAAENWYWGLGFLGIVFIGYFIRKFLV